MTSELRPAAALLEEIEAVHDVHDVHDVHAARKPRRARMGRSALLTVIAVLGFGGLFWLGYLPKLKQRAWLGSQAASSAARVSEVKLVRHCLPTKRAC
jgi:hypothetical protein